MSVNPIALFLVMLILLGVLSNNGAITLSATILLLIQQTMLVKYLPILDKYALNAGIVLLMIGVLSPIVSGKTKLPELSTFLNVKMMAAVIIGIGVAWIAGRGVPLMSTQPLLVVGLLIGTIIGVAFLGGIPVGPLIAAGILSLLIEKV
ncbi:DUF441 domain-containing protein [Wielerella bovis]|uniref:DUF441 domain-containing protein n=1 Tax=Wielerella bovis TaxID=2917790 RepID=UPI002019111A|nr:DUF441 family protein [Wielerella bovis]ULJ64895.1 DUF441 domain-containing protein [Wielerella bovis]ULJ67168.1 DUF441 domain-containing protein [Wielerella bovis]